MADRTLYMLYFQAETIYDHSGGSRIWKRGFPYVQGWGKVRPVCERLHAKQAAISCVAPHNAVVGRA